LGFTGMERETFPKFMTYMELNPSGIVENNKSWNDEKCKILKVRNQ
jgi:hypothetical protein